ncbi:MAG: caspase family protein [Actinobacteria bacterium]|nr:caspase family protein [Actinomycetota bacterium]
MRRTVISALVVGLVAALVVGGLSLLGRSSGIPTAEAQDEQGLDVRAAAQPSTGALAARGAAPRAEMQRFNERFPAQAAATQDVREPATTRWAVLIGINDHQGPTRDNIGSRQDAELLRDHLLDLGWRDDHIVLLTEADAIRDNVEEAIAWLARKTDPDSVAIFHYSGHTKQWWGEDVDGDGEVPDEGLWPSDNDRIPDGEFVARMAPVDAGRLWINIAACEAEGFADPGLARPGRTMTFSSREEEKSYEEPRENLSIWGHHLIKRGMVERLADTNGDARVSVEEAFHFAVPPAAERSVIGSHGSQNGVIVDPDAEPFHLDLPVSGRAPTAGSFTT